MERLNPVLLPVFLLVLVNELKALLKRRTVFGAEILGKLVEVKR